MEARRNVLLVTGASGALGGAVVARGRADGAAIIAVERSNNSTISLARVAEAELRLRAPLTDEALLAEGVARAEAELGPVTQAVLAAGTWRGGQPMYATSPDEYRALFEANLDSAVAVLRVLLAGMVERRHGSVVLVGSRAAARPFEARGQAAYAASKAALIAMMQACAAEVLEAGVRINAVLPSTIDTPANRRAMPDADSSRWVTLESLSSVVSFLLSDAASDVSGAALPVYGRA
jgi:NAD(P)-dependent dehydrogenase (short-subunit alcohol dehydrogenase family)